MRTDSEGLTARRACTCAMCRPLGGHGCLLCPSRRHAARQRFSTRHTARCAAAAPPPPGPAPPLLPAPQNCLLYGFGVCFNGAGLLFSGEGGALNPGIFSPRELLRGEPGRGAFQASGILSLCRGAHWGAAGPLGDCVERHVPHAGARALALAASRAGSRLCGVPLARPAGWAAERRSPARLRALMNLEPSSARPLLPLSTSAGPASPPPYPQATAP